MRTTAIVAALCCLFLAGCVSANDPNAVAKGTNTSFNPHTGFTTTSGAPSAINGNILEGLFNVRTIRGGDGQVIHQVYLAVSSSGWLFLDSAYAYGKQLTFVPIDRSVSYCSQYGCTVTETVGINLSDDELRQFSSTGFIFQLSGKRGDRVVSIPATYFQGYLSKLTS